MEFKVVEKFISINGEGRLSGQLAVFIRFAHCNLDCSYCDTSWANKSETPYSLMTLNAIYEYIKSTDIKNITLTGGEPLLQENILELLEMLSKDSNINVEIETNGSVPITRFSNIENPPSFTLDYKLPSSGMEDKMLLENFKYLTPRDSIKFVCGSITDLDRANYIMSTHNLISKTTIYISPVFDEINPKDLVEYMKINKMNGVNLGIQLHKIIWDPSQRGV